MGMVPVGAFPCLGGRRSEVVRGAEVIAMLAPAGAVPVTGLGYGSRPDYGVGPYLLLMGAAVRLARRDLRDPELAPMARAFLDGELVALFGECLGYGGSF